jgi:hypothetical protein
MPLKGSLFGSAQLNSSDYLIGAVSNMPPPVSIKLLFVQSARSEEIPPAP